MEKVWTSADEEEARERNDAEIRAWKPTAYMPLRAQEAPRRQASLFAEPRTEPRELEGEPDPSTWKRCVCGHDMYIHNLPGYETDGIACLYGEGCTCARFRKCTHPATQEQKRFDGEIDAVCTQCGGRV